MSRRGSEFENRRHRSPISTTTLLMIIEYFLPRYSLWSPPPSDPINAPMTYNEAGKMIHISYPSESRSKDVSIITVKTYQTMNLRLKLFLFDSQCLQTELALNLSWQRMILLSAEWCLQQSQERTKNQILIDKIYFLTLILSIMCFCNLSIDNL